MHQYKPQADEIQLPLIYQFMSKCSSDDYGYNFNWLPNEKLFYEDITNLDTKGARAMIGIINIVWALKY